LEAIMPGRKTHEQQLRTFERKPDVPDARRTETELNGAVHDAAHVPKRDQRQSEFPVSRHGAHQESQHNKHNDPPQGAAKKA